jgi:hypothetical protein
MTACRSFLDGSGGGVPLVKLLLSLPKKQHVKRMLSETGISPEQSKDPALYLAYVCAMLTALAFAEYPTVDDDAISQILGNPTADEEGVLRRYVPAMLCVFVWTLTSTRVRGGDEHGLFGHADTDPEACDRRALKLITAFAGIVGTTQGKGEFLELIYLHEYAREYVTVVLMLDRSGVSDRVIKDLHKLNLCTGPGTGRKLIAAASKQLSLETVFLRTEDQVPALVFSADKDDINFFWYDP